MKTSPYGVSLIKDFEGLERVAYRDIADVWTIGYGHTETARPGMTITEDEADALLRKDLETREQAILSMVSAPINQMIFDALVSFVYNVGETAFRGSTARKRLNAGDYEGAAEALTWWNKARVNGALTIVEGLTRRRAREALMVRHGAALLRAVMAEQARETGEVTEPGGSALTGALAPAPAKRKPEAKAFRLGRFIRQFFQSRKRRGKR